MKKYENVRINLEDENKKNCNNLHCYDEKKTFDPQVLPPSFQQFLNSAFWTDSKFMENMIF